MSYSKMAFERDDPDPFERCSACGEFTDECICSDVATEGHHVESEAEADDDAFFAPWAEAMVKAEISRGQLDRIWERIKIKLEDLGKVEQVIADIWGHRTWMVDR